MEISLIDPLSKGIIDIPVRGINCQHLDCFSLKNYLMSIDSSKPRHWKCPICRSLANELQIDGFIREVLEFYGHAPNIEKFLIDQEGNWFGCKNE